MGFRNNPENWERAEWLEGQMTLAVRALAGDDREHPGLIARAPREENLCVPHFLKHTLFLTGGVWELGVRHSQRARKGMRVIN